MFRSMFFCLSLLLVGVALPSHATSSNKADPQTPSDAHPNPEEISAYSFVLRKIERDYYQKLDWDIEGRIEDFVASNLSAEDAIKNLLDELDDHSEYISPKQLKMLATDSSGLVFQTGIGVFEKDNRFVVSRLGKGSTSEASGLLVGDTLLEINGLAVAERTIFEVQNRLKSEESGQIKLLIDRDGRHIELDIALLAYDEPEFELTVSDEILVVRLNEFSENLSNELRISINNLESTDGLRGVVIDLRGNAGGILTSIASTLDLFIDGGHLFSIRGNVPAKDKKFEASNGDVLVGAPILIITDEFTASGAELFAGVMQTYDRALIYGYQTQGFGKVQSLMPISGLMGAAFKFTTHQIFFNENTLLEGQGITPDILPNVTEVLGEIPVHHLKRYLLDESVK